MNEREFNLFFKTYRDQVFGYLYAIVKKQEVAEDLTQEIFMKFWTCSDLVAQVKNLDNYIFILSRNRALNYLRKVKNDQKALDEIKMLFVDRHEEVDEQMLMLDYLKLLNEAVESLSAQRKLVYTLSRHKGLSINEIADHLQLSPNTVKNHLITSLKTVRLYLEQHGGIALLLLALI